MAARNPQWSPHPLRLGGRLVPKLWGGTKLQSVLRRRTPRGPAIGESWDIFHHGPGREASSSVAEGPLKGELLSDLIQRWPMEILGQTMARKYRGTLELTLKILDTGSDMSIQVHPDDEFAGHYESGAPGKTEAWYVLHADPGTEATRGVLPGTSTREFLNLLKQNRITECLNTFALSAGDCIFVPPGTVHSLSPGALVLEIQETSDITYRIHDWGRLDAQGRSRELHIEKALKIIDFHYMGQSKCRPTNLAASPCRRDLLVKCEKFGLESLKAAKAFEEKGDPRRYHWLTLVEGGVEIAWRQGREEKRVRPELAETLFMPASLESYAVTPKSGGCKLLKTLPTIDD